MSKAKPDGSFAFEGAECPYCTARVALEDRIGGKPHRCKRRLLLLRIEFLEEQIAAFADLWRSGIPKAPIPDPKLTDYDFDKWILAKSAKTKTTDKPEEEAKDGSA